MIEEQNSSLVERVRSELARCSFAVVDKSLELDCVLVERTARNFVEAESAGSFEPDKPAKTLHARRACRLVAASRERSSGLVRWSGRKRC